MKKQLLGTLLGAALALPLMAQAEGTYIGANVGRTQQKLSDEDVGSVKDNTTGLKLYGGYEITKNFGAEVGYVHFGKGEASANDGVNSASISAKPKAFYLAATGTLPLNDQFSLFAKAGVARNSTKVTGTLNGASESETLKRTGAMFGLGAAYNVTKNVAIVAEYENFGKVVNEDGANLKADLVSVGVRYKF
jgi:OOP family OmpA-OmpF porin